MSFRKADDLKSGFKEQSSRRAKRSTAAVPPPLDAGCLAPRRGARAAAPRGDRPATVAARRPGGCGRRRRW